MKRHWIIVFIVLLAGLALTAFFYARPTVINNVPTRIPSRSEIVPPGSYTTDVLKTTDEARIPELIPPSGIVMQATGRLMETSCKDGTNHCKLQAIYDFVRTNIEFTDRTLESPFIRPPGELLLYGRGDAVELALLIASMQRAAGFKNEIVRAKSSVWVRTFVGNESIMIDPSCPGCRIMEARVSLQGNEIIYK